MDSWKIFFVGLGTLFLLFFMIPFHVHHTASPELEQQFIEFQQRFNKSYENERAYQHHFNAFQQSIEAIDKLNSQRKHHLSAVYGLTKYSDMTPEEFLDKHLQSDLYNRISSRNSKESGKHRNRELIKGLPLKIDWREKGVVTKMNNQKLCGACWAFSTAETIESMYAIKTGKLIQLSVQQLIDCAGYNNSGCAGGDAYWLLKWMKDYNVKVHTEEEYPLHLKTETCKTVNVSSGVQINEFECNSVVGNEDFILSTLNKTGPVAVAVNAVSWQNYLGGVIQFHCSGAPEFLNHAVQIVGYDLAADIPYYIVRNSWGEDFGDKGYLYIAIGENICGLANEVSTVLSIL